MHLRPWTKTLALPTKVTLRDMHFSKERLQIALNELLASSPFNEGNQICLNARSLHNQDPRLHLAILPDTNCVTKLKPFFEMKKNESQASPLY